MKIDDIIGKFFLGKESKEELAILEAWKLESEGNLAAINQLETYWKNYEEIKDYKEYNKVSAWDVISDQMDKKDAEPESKTVPLKLWQIAASLVILLGAFYFIKIDGEKARLTESLISIEEKSERSLEDGSVVWLNANTTADFSGFTKTDRTLKLVEGEGYFSIASDKINPFVITAGDFNIEVVGTEFNVNYTNEEFEIFVQEGRVLVSNGKRKVYLNAGDMISGNSASFGKKSNANPNIISWKTNTLIFKNSQLIDVVQDLSEYYNVDIQLEKGLNHMDCFLSTSFSDEKIEDVLLELEALFQINSHKTGNTIVIDKVNC